jgi:hypothetical protein
MVRLFRICILCVVAIASAACSSSKPPTPSRPVSVAGTTTLAITNGVRVLANLPMPPGFAPIEGRPPVWLQSGTELGVVGTLDGHVIVFGFSGQGWHNQRIIAAEVGPDAAEAGTIVDAAASPDGMTFATAVAVQSEKRLDIVLRDLIASGPGHPLTSFDGVYDLVSMHWISNSTIAIALRARPEPAVAAPVASQSPEEAAAQPPPPKASSGLQLLVVTGPGSVAPLALPCPISVMQWSPHGIYAVGMGDEKTPPVIVDRRKSTCTTLAANPPVEVLGWEPETENAFLFVQTVEGKNRGVYEHNLASGRDRLIAVASGAACYVGNGPILAYGNQRLTWKAIAENPLQPVVAEFATFDPDKPEIDIRQLGFRTVPTMIESSTMTYTLPTDRVLLQTFEPAVPVPMRKLIVYAERMDSAFQVAFGPAKGVVQASWSPRGHWIAILDGDATGSTLTVISPPG